jgi:hypothetical protein
MEETYGSKTREYLFYLQPRRAGTSQKKKFQSYARAIPPFRRQICTPQAVACKHRTNVTDFLIWKPDYT